MVSFSCDCCGDVIKKPKLNNHASGCRGISSWTCIDCMKVFNLKDVASHTACMSEAQKYQGSLYRGDKKKGQKSNIAKIQDQPPKPNSDNLNNPGENGKLSNKKRKIKEDTNADHHEATHGNGEEHSKKTKTTHKEASEQTSTEEVQQGSLENAFTTNLRWKKNIKRILKKESNHQLSTTELKSKIVAKFMQQIESELTQIAEEKINQLVPFLEISVDQTVRLAESE